jgi:hypothetical protein
MRNLFTGHDDVADQPGEIACGRRDGALFFDNELDQTLAHAFYFLCIKKFTAQYFTAFQDCALWLIFYVGG